MFRLYRGYANSDRSQLEGKKTRLGVDLAQNKTTTIVAPSGGNTGWAYRVTPNDPPNNIVGGAVAFGNEERVFRIEYTGVLGYPKVRRSSQSVVVPYSKLSNQMQKILRQGGKIASVTQL